MLKEKKMLITSRPNLKEMIFPVFTALSQSELRGYILISSLYRIEWFNKKASQIMTDFFNKKVRINDSISKFVNDFLISKYLPYFSEAAEGKASTFEIKLENPSGIVRWFEINLLPCSFNEDSSNALLIVITDITDKKNALASVELQEKLLNVLSIANDQLHRTSNVYSELNSLMKLIGANFDFDLIFYHDLSRGFSNGNTKYYHRTMENNADIQSISSAMLGYFEKSLKANCPVISEIVPRDFLSGKFFSKNKIKTFVLSPVFAGNNFRGYIAYIDFDKKHYWSISQWETLASLSVRIGYAFHRLEYEKNLIKAKEKAEVADKIKSEFLAQLSHEIRTPINTILSFTSLIKEELQCAENESINIYGDMIERGSKRLVRTMDMMVQMAEFQTGSYLCKKEKFNLYNDVIQKIIEEYKPAISSKNISLVVKREIDNDFLTADLHSINEIFVQIFDNAVKFTNEGQISLLIGRNEKNILFANISDTGIGFSEDYYPHLFTPFSQEEMGYSRKYEGNGLGLALVKKYLEINNAEIDVKSKKNSGTSFTVFFANS